MWALHSGELFYVDVDGAAMAASTTLVLGRVTKLFDLQKPARFISASDES